MTVMHVNTASVCVCTCVCMYVCMTSFCVYIHYCIGCMVWVLAEGLLKGGVPGSAENNC